MKIVYILNALTHYYNLVLSRINNEPGIELATIFPSKGSRYVGEGVYQTKDGINFRIIGLEERDRYIYKTFKGLANVLKYERPDIIVVPDIYLLAFIFDPFVALAVKSLNAGIVLSMIPFGLMPYDQALRKIKEKPLNIKVLPSFLNNLLNKIGLGYLIKKARLNIVKKAYNLADAHVNYIEAYELLSTYGIDREKIFVTRNSPDTDKLFDIKASLKNVPPILPPNPYRIVHVGRLVEWKRIDMLLRAFSRVRRLFANAELLIIGTGPQEKELKKLAEALDLSTSVIFTGGVYDPRRLGQYFMASSLYVLAGMGGLSINDAMSFGLPVLCSVCDGTEKFLVRERENGRYFRKDDEDDLFDKIVWFLKHSDQLAEMGTKSEEIIRNEVNIHTVINGYMEAVRYVQQKRKK